MPLSLKSEKAEVLARKIAAKTGESLTGAIQKALEERWERLRNQQRAPAIAEQIGDILHRVDGLPTVDSRSEGEILGYDDNGIPS
jgi:antitoxin VapB